MVNCNPETVSTDYSTSDRLYFEPLTDEDVAAVIASEAAACATGARLRGVIVCLGGQTPLKLAHSLDPALVLGTPVAAIDSAEDRERWSAICSSLGLRQPPGGVATSRSRGARDRRARRLPGPRSPELRPGRAGDGDRLRRRALARAMDGLTRAHGALTREGGVSAERPILIDSFLESATEVDVDAVRDGAGEVFVAGVMEHVEEAGVHSGDSACALPPPTLDAAVIDEIAEATGRIAAALGVVGPLNVQFAVRAGEVYVLEANPRASRTVPFVAKATGVALARVATRVMLGETLAQLRAAGVVPDSTPAPAHVSVKEAVLPFARFPGVDTVLGPEMRSTGEVMGIGESFGIAFAKAQLAAGARLPDAGRVFFSLADRDKPSGLALATELAGLGFTLAATAGTAAALRAAGLEVEVEVERVGAGGRDAVAMIADGEVQLVVNTPSGGGARRDGALIRGACVAHGVPGVTTLAAGFAAARGIADTRERGWRVATLQELHR